MRVRFSPSAQIRNWAEKIKRWAVMKDSELIQQMRAKTFLRIRDLMVSRYKEALAEEKFVNKWLRLGLNQDDLSAEPSLEALEWMCSAPLTDMAVHLLWAVAAKATNGTFVANGDNLADAVETIDFKDLVRLTGFKADDAVFILVHVVDSLAETIREHVTIDVLIDHKPVQLQT